MVIDRHFYTARLFLSLTYFLLTDLFVAFELFEEDGVLPLLPFELDP